MDSQRHGNTTRERALPPICTSSNPCCLEIRYTIIIIAVLEILSGILGMGFYSLILFGDNFLSTVGAQIQVHWQSGSSTSYQDPTFVHAKNNYDLQLKTFLIFCKVALSFAVIQSVASIVSIFVLNHTWMFIWAGILTLRIITELIPLFIGSIFGLFHLPWTIIQAWFLWVIIAYGVHLKQLRRIRNQASGSTMNAEKEQRQEINHIFLNQGRDPNNYNYNNPPPNYVSSYT